MHIRNISLLNKKHFQSHVPGKYKIIILYVLGKKRRYLKFENKTHIQKHFVNINQYDLMNFLRDFQNRFATRTELELH